ncbi:hypothetical protein THIOSC13_540004 [uncultured Thiomicrorhabdus sp.]
MLKDFSVDQCGSSLKFEDANKSDSVKKIARIFLGGFKFYL